jgi:hypothetical protein
MEGGVDHAVRHRGALTEPFEIIQIAPMHLGACGRKRFDALR